MNRASLRRLGAAALAAAAVVAACQPYQPRWSIPQGPPAYRAGYTDGCLTAQEAAISDVHPLRLTNPKVYKDAQRFEEDIEYRAGWNDAYETCYARERTYQSTINPGNGGGRAR